MPDSTRISHFPIPFFGSAMGLSGFAIALMRYGHEMAIPAIATTGRSVLYATAVWLLFLMATYLQKLIRYPAHVHEEWQHPVRKNFFAAISISLLLLAIGFYSIAPVVSFWLWHIGTAIHFIFLIQVFRSWITAEFSITAMNPAWFIPVVGTILVPIAGVAHANPEVSWFFFSIGIVYWIVLLSIVLNRIIFHNPLPERLYPTLCILIAPPAVGFLAYLKLNGGELDMFARVLYYQALFTTLLLLSLINRFRAIPFSLAWWAYTFPLAAITIATVQISLLLPQIALFSWLATGFLLLTGVVICVATLRTVSAIRQHQICVPE